MSQDWHTCAVECPARAGGDSVRRRGLCFDPRQRRGGTGARAFSESWRALFRDHLLSDLLHLGERERGMVRHAKRRVPRPRPSEDQRKFLELLRDFGPRDNAQTAAVLKTTKRACQVRGWVEWRSLDNFPGKRAWHLTIIGRNALNSLARRSRAIPARLPSPFFGKPARARPIRGAP